MAMTHRDNNIIDFLTDYNIASASTLAHLFFPSRNRCQQRLGQLYKAKKIKRERLNINSDYLYYIKRPAEGYMTHNLLITQFYDELIKRYGVESVKFTKTQKVEHMIPDGRFMVKDSDGKYHVGFLEVEISNKTFDYQKYLDFYENQDYKKIGLPSMPTVYVVYRYSNIMKIPQYSPIKFILIKPDMSNFRID